MTLDIGEFDDCKKCLNKLQRLIQETKFIRKKEKLKKGEGMIVLDFRKFSTHRQAQNATASEHFRPLIWPPPQEGSANWPP